MTPEAQRIAIAEACGFTGCTNPTCDFSKCFHLHYHGGNAAYFMDTISTHRVPDYLNDVGAIHSAVVVMTDDKTRRLNKYINTLWVVVLGRVHWENASSSQFFDYLNASAAQRAEAFLRTIGKWVES